MNRERREERPDDAESAEEFKLKWGDAEDRWTEAAEDKGEFSPSGGRERVPGRASSVAEGVPWDDLADEGPAEFEESSFIDRASRLVPDSDDDESESGSPPDDESPPHGDPLEREAEDDVFEPGRPSTRMDSLQDALASIRERVQTLSGETRPGASGVRAAQSSQLALYRAATDDRTLAELRRHSRDTEDLLRRMSALMQDLSLDLRSIVDAARRAIDQTSEQAESSIELGRLLGERIEQMDTQLSARMASLEQGRRGKGADSIEKQVDQIDAAIGTLQVHIDKRLTRLEQRSGVGMLREDMGEIRADLGDVRGELGDVRSQLGTLHEVVGAASATAHDAGSPELEQRLDVVSGQLDRTLTILRELTEAGPEQDEDAVDGVAAVIRTETEAAVEPLRGEVEELGRQLGEALDREQELGTTLATLTDEVQRLRKRIAVRHSPPAIDDEQIQTIADAVVAALPGGAAAPVRRSRAVEPEPEPEPGDELDVEPVREPEAEPAPPPKRKRTRPARVKKAPAAQPEPEPEYELDINEPFAPGALDIDDSHLDVDPDEEPLRRARGTGRKSNRPLTKGRRTRSSSK